jgi:hypothetical protein
MKNEEQYNENWSDEVFESELGTLFTYHLVRVFCVKSHLSERLPELCSQSEFKDLYLPIQDTITDIENQLQKISNAFKFLEAPGIMDDCSSTIAMMEGAFSMIYKWAQIGLSRDINTLYYLQSLSDIELRSFQIIEILSNNFRNTDIKILIKKFHNEAKKPNVLQQILLEQHLVHGTLFNQPDTI